MMNRLFVSLALVLAFAVPTSAQQLKLEISDGRVNLDANAVPVRQILSEWARIGGTKVVGGDKITGAPVTLKLVNATEREALDILLRNVAGFMAAPRQASAAPGASGFDRILILATSSAPSQASNARGSTPATNPNARGGPMNGTQRGVPPRPPNLPPSPAEDEAETEDEPESDQVAQQPVFTFPAPPGSVTPGGNNPVFVPMSNMGQIQPVQGGINVPVISLQPGPNGPTIYNFVPNTGTTPGAAPANGPFTVIGSPTPGMIQQPAGTPPPTRPPGR